MRWSRCRVGAVLVGLVLLAADCAWSDGPLGFGEPLGRFAEGLGIVLIVEPLVVLGEALVYTKFVGLRFLRALGTSFLGNLASYFAGVLVWLLLSSVFYGSVFSREARWALGFPLTLLVEVPIVIGINRGVVDYRRLRNWAIYANCASYLLVWLIVEAIQGI